jgi:hypothetical protein
MASTDARRSTAVSSSVFPTGRPSDPVMPLPTGLRANPFGVEWDQLTLADVERFLDSVRDQDEGLSWEAKGGPEARREHVLTALSAFGNSVDGGYLVIGAERRTRGDPWVVAGSAFRDEPSLWVTQVASTIISPPAFDVHSFRLAERRDVAVVAIAPKPDPPVITPSGVINRRRPGQSPPVRDPAELREIVRGGQAALERAKQQAIDAMRPLMVESDARFPVVVVGLSTAGLPSDITTRLFTEPFKQALDDATMSSATNRRYGSGIGVADAGTAIVAKQTGWNPTEFDLVVRADVTGGVGAVWRYMNEHDVVEDVIREPRLIRTAWQAAHECVVAFGGYGPAYISMYVHGHGAQHYSAWTRGEGPTDGEVARIVRQMRRARGEVALEP